MKPCRPFICARPIAFYAGTFLASTFAVQATDYDFTGTTNGAWHTGTNWQGGATPTFNNLADLKFGVNNTMATNASWLGTGNRTVRSLEFANISSALTINLGSDNASNTARVLTFDTDAVGGDATIKVNSTVSANVTIGSPGTVGSITLADNLVVTNDSTTSTLTLNKVVSETGGAKSLTKDGVGILQLNSANTFTGKTAVNGGVVRINADSRLGTAPGSLVADQLTLNGGTLRTYAAMTMNANRGITLGASGGSIDVNTGDLTYAGTITGPGSLSTSGDTTSRALNLEAANDYSGSTTINSGVLRLQPNGTISSSSNVSVNGSGNFNVRNTANWVYNGTITGDGTGQMNLNSGTNATLTGNISGVKTITAGSSATFANTAISGDISGADTAISVQNAATTLTLTGTNTYSGTTTVTNGTLIIDGDNSGATGTVTVTGVTGGTLKGAGSTGGAVIVSASSTLAPGASIESLATGALDLQANSTYAYEINNTVAASMAGDLTAVDGDLTLDLGNLANLSLTELGAGSWTLGDKLTLISYSGAWNGGLFHHNAATLADDSGFAFSDIDWLFNYDDSTPGSNFTDDLTGSKFVTMTAVPEPSALLLSSLGLLGLLRRRR